MPFYHVTYRSTKGRKKAIVQAENPREAGKRFNNPDDPFGMHYEIVEVRNAKRISEGWTLMVQSKGDFPLSLRLRSELSLEDPEGAVDAGKGDFKVKHVLSAAPPAKEHVMKGRFLG